MKKYSFIAAALFVLFICASCGGAGAGVNLFGKTKVTEKAGPTVSPAVTKSGGRITPTEKAPEITQSPGDNGQNGNSGNDIAPTAAPSKSPTAAPTSSIIIGKSDNIVTDSEKKALLESVEKEVNSLAQDIASLEEPSDKDLYYN